MSELHLTADEQALLDTMRADDDAPDTAPPASPAAEPAASPSPETAAEERPPRETVPYGEHENVKKALQAERALRYQEQERVKQEQGRMKLLEERTNLLLEGFTRQQSAPQAPAAAEPAKPQIPDLATDPVGNIVGNIEFLKRQQLDQERAWQEQQQHIASHLQQQQLRNAVVQQARAFEQQFQIEHPDYGDAVKHLTAVKHREFEALGISDPGQRQMILEQQGLQTAEQQIREGRNPAAAIYELAKIYGFAPGGSTPAPGANSSALEPPAAGAPNGQPSPQERLQNIAAGQQQSPSLGNLRGSGPAPLTAQRLLAMSPEEFYKLRDNPEARALMGA